MELSNCCECGKLHLKNVRTLCPQCNQVFNEQTEKVLEYLKNNYKTTVNEISAGTGVKTSFILQLMQKGFFLNGKYRIFYPCESCGKLIEHGRICQSCCKVINDFCIRTFPSSKEKRIFRHGKPNH